METNAWPPSNITAYLQDTSVNLVIEGASGIITAWQGQPLTLKSGGRVVASASAETHGELLKVLAS